MRMRREGPKHLKQAVMQLQRILHDAGESVPCVRAHSMKQPLGAGIGAAVMHDVNDKVQRQLPCNVLAVMHTRSLCRDCRPPHGDYGFSSRLRGAAAVTGPHFIRIIRGAATNAPTTIKRRSLRNPISPLYCRPFTFSNTSAAG